jgi:hypothetical protein
MWWEVHGLKAPVPPKVHWKIHPPRTLHPDYAYGPTVALRGRAVSYERGTPVSPNLA